MDNLNAFPTNCPPRADYSTVRRGNRILPFVFELDFSASNLRPGPSQNQRFCYKITAVGRDNRNYGDLSHFLFGICPDIPQDQLRNVTVTINGVSQGVIIGSNVEIFNPPKTDPSTRCSGLKFDFGLNKVNGEMTLCFELTETYPIGPVELCLFGANETKRGLNICGPICNGHTDPTDDCSDKNVYVPATVCADVVVTPYVESLEPTTYCRGPHRISTSPSTCPGVENGVIQFTVSQDICIKIPLEFGATTSVGNPFVEAGTPTRENICDNSNGDCNS